MLKGKIKKIGVEYFLEVEKSFYKIRGIYAQELGLEKECDGLIASAEEATEIFPPKMCNGWVRTGSLRLGVE